MDEKFKNAFIKLVEVSKEMGGCEAKIKLSGFSWLPEGYEIGYFVQIKEED